MKPRKSPLKKTKSGWNKLHPGVKIFIVLFTFFVLATTPFLRDYYQEILSPSAYSQANDPVVVGAGDITSCSRSQDDATANLIDSINGTVITFGDNAYTNGNATEFANCYNPTWGRHKARTKPAPGNHDYNTAGGAGYYGYFGAAATPDNPTCTSNCNGYYSYNIGSWHIVVLNGEISHNATSPQVQWLENDLSANPSDCTLAYWHEPRFSSGSNHGSNSGFGAVWNVLYNHKADVVLNGHEHLYERFALQNPNGLADPSGIREFVVGTGGASLYPFGTPLTTSEVRENTAWGVLKLTLHATSYDWEFVPIAGQSFNDSGSSNCVGVSVTPTPTAEITPTIVPSPTPTIFSEPTPTTVPATPTPVPASPTPTPVRTQLVIPVNADAHIRQSYPNRNYGSTTRLETDNSPVKHILLKFTVSGVGTGTVTNAKIRLYNVDKSSYGGTIYAVADTSWTENTVTWNTAPAASGPVLSSLGSVNGTTSAPKPYEFDVTGASIRDGVVGFRIISPSSNGADYISRQGTAALVPQLILTVAP